MRVAIDNQYYYTDSEDFKTVLNGFKIEGLAEYIQDLENSTVYEEKRFNSDMISYESQIEEYQDLLQDTQEELKTLRMLINNSRRLNKESIIQSLHKIENRINANL